MSTRERINIELNSIDDESLDELYEIVKRYVALRRGSGASGIMAKLSRVRIQGPPDFSENLDLYLSGEKRGEADFWPRLLPGGLAGASPRPE